MTFVRFGSPKVLVEELLGKEIADEIQPVWGLNSEGEINSAWRSAGYPDIYFMMGNLAMCRFFSSHLALCECPFRSVEVDSSLTYNSFSVIKAHEEGLAGDRYVKGVQCK